MDIQTDNELVDQSQNWTKNTLRLDIQTDNELVGVTTVSEGEELIGLGLLLSEGIVGWLYLVTNPESFIWCPVGGTASERVAFELEVEVEKEKEALG